MEEVSTLVDATTEELLIATPVTSEGLLKTLVTSTVEGAGEAELVLLSSDVLTTDQRLLMDKHTDTVKP